MGIQYIISQQTGSATGTAETKLYIWGRYLFWLANEHDNLQKNMEQLTYIA